MCYLPHQTEPDALPPSNKRKIILQASGDTALSLSLSLSQSLGTTIGRTKTAEM